MICALLAAAAILAASGELAPRNESAPSELPPEAFYPLHWEAVAQYADGAHAASDAEAWATISARSLA